MIGKNKICVVVPAYNEFKLIRKVIETMPDFVDMIVIVDDASTDKTVVVAKESKSHGKLEILVFKKNQGVGRAIVAGYKKAIESGMDVVAVMAGDAQMDPLELKDLIQPIIDGQADVVKGNRLIYGRAWQMMPKVRYLGNSVLSLLTKMASGYWHVADSQTGYIAISCLTLKKINLDNLYARYGFPNDLLVHLNIVQARLKELPIKPIYNENGKSGIRLWKVIPTISWLLWRRFWWRLKRKYIIEDFHPLIFFYVFSFLLSLSSIILLIRLILVWAATTHIPPINAMTLIFCAIMASQFLFFAMWFDMDYNKDLKVK